MFESIVGYLLNKYLDKYVDHLDTDQLNVGIFSGTVQLNDLKLKPEALYELNLPIAVKAGCIGKISIDLPWMTLYTDPILVHVEDILIVAAPVSDLENTPELEVRLARAAKTLILAQLEETLPDEELASQPLGFFENLVATLVNNIQVSIQNIHVRYEDRSSYPGHTVAVGASLQSVTAITTNCKWKPTQIDGDAKTIFKLVKMECLSLYCNPSCRPDCLASSKTGDISWKISMKNALASLSMEGEEFDFIVKPVSAKVKMIFNKTMEDNVPRLLLDFVLQDAAAQVSKEQYLTLYRVIDSFSRLQISRQFTHYKTKSAETPKSRWHFAYKSVLEEYIRPYSWARIVQHRKKCGRYVEMYKRFLQQPEEVDLKQKIQNLEDTLDAVNILLAREQAKLQLLRHGRDQVQKKPVSKSWWRSWWDGGSEEPVLVENQNRSIWSRLSSEERDRLRELYKPPPPGSPAAPEAIGHKLNFTLANFTFSLLRCNNDKTSTPGEILVITLTQFLTSLETRPEAKAFKLSARTESFVVEGAASDTDLVPIMTADNLVSGNNLSHVFALDFEKNPLLVEAVFGLTVNAEPMEVVYHENAVSELISFFHLPSLNFPELKNLAVAQFMTAANFGRSALEYALTTRQTIHLSVDLKSPYIVIPEHGSLQKSGKVLVVDMGRLIINSDLQPQSSLPEETTKMELEEILYDRFNIVFSDIQILFSDSGDEWRTCRLKPESDLHLMPKIRIQLLFSNSINPDYKQLPKQKINLSIPTLKLNLSDRRIRHLVQFVHTLPLPRALTSDATDGTEFPTYQPLDPLHILKPLSTSLLRQTRHLLYLRHGLGLASRSASQNSLHGSDQDFDELTSAEASSDEEGDDEWARGIDLPGFEDNVSPNNCLLGLARIQLGSVEVHLQRSAGDRADRPYLLLRLEQACADFAWLEHGPALQASLGALTLVDKLHPGPSGEYLELISTQNQSDMFTILYRKVRANCPDFKSHFHQVEHSLVLDLSSAAVMFHREAFRTLARFLQYLVSRMQPNGSSVASLTSLDFNPGPLLVDPEHDPPVPHGATKFSISARVGQVQARLCDTDLDLALLHVAGLECDYILKANERMVIRLNLNEASIEDLMDATLYTKILTIEDDKVFEFKYIHYSAVPVTKESIEPQDADPVRMDGSLRLKIGRLQLVFLSKFFLELQRFFEPFILPKVSQMAKKSATALVNQKLWEFKEQGLKLKLHIDIAAPSILLPQKSSSANLLVLSLGDLSLENFFSPPTVDNILLRLEHLHMARALILLDGTLQSQEAILEPMKLRVDIKRTVPPLMGRDVLYDISGNMDTIQVNIGQRDLATLLAVIRENFTEGRLVDNPKPSSCSTSPLEATTPSTSAPGDLESVRKLEAFLSTTTDVTVKALVNFILEGVVVTLYTDPDEVLSSPQREPTRALSRLEVSEMRAGATLYYDRALEVRCSLQAATLEDVRPASTLALRKIFQSYSGDNQLFGSGTTGISISMPPMVDVTYKQTGNGDAAVDVVIEKTRMNVSVPYILTLVKFVLDALPSLPPQQHVPVQAATSSSTTSHRRLPSDSTSGYHSTASEPDLRGLSISAVLKKPEVILFADPNEASSQVVVLKMDVLFDYSRNLGQENFVTSITGLHVLSCSYGHRQQTMTTVLEQCDVELSRSYRLSEDEVRANISFSPLHITLSPSIIHTLTDVATDLADHIKEASAPAEEELSGGSKPDPSGLWTPERIASSKWMDTSVSVPACPARPPSYPGETSKVQEFLSVQIPQVQIVCQLLDGSRQIPVLLARAAFSSDIHNWSSQIYLNGEVQLEIVYYNEKLSTWEPLLEPVMESEGNYRPWELLFKVFRERSHPILCNRHGNCLLPSNEGDRTDARSSGHGTLSVSSSSGEDTDQETGMTVIRRHAQPRAKRQTSVKSHDSSSMLAYPADSDSSENEEGVLEKIASTFGHMFSEDNSEEEQDGEGAEEHVAEVKSDSGDTETADHSVNEDFPLFGPSGKGDDAVDQVLVDTAVSSPFTALFVIVDSRDMLDFNMSYSAIVVISQILQCFSKSSSLRSKMLFTTFSCKKPLIKNYLGPEAKVTAYHKAEKDEEYKPLDDSQGYHGNPPPNVPNQTMLPLVDVSPADSDSEITVDEADGFSLLPPGKTPAVELPPLPYRDALTVSQMFSNITQDKVSIEIEGFEKLQVFIPSRDNSRMYALPPVKHKTRYYIVVDVDMCHGLKSVTVSSPLKLEMHPLVGRPLHLLCPQSQLESVGAEVDRYSRNPFHQNMVQLTLLEPGHSYHVPLLVAYHCKLYLQPLADLADPTPFEVSSDSLWWQDGTQRVSKLVVCSSSADPNNKFCVRTVYVENTHVESPSVGTKLVPNYTIHILPPVIIHNDLPFPIELQKPGLRVTLMEGDMVPVFDFDPTKSQKVQVELSQYGGLPWHGKLEIACDLEEHRPIPMKCDTGSAVPVLRQLSINVAVMSSPNLDIHLFSPYWIVNLTGLPLHIRGAASEVVCDTSSEEPLLFRFKKHKKKKAKLQVYESKWSQAFSLDTVGNSGVVFCLDKERNKKYRFFLNISWASSISQFSKLVVIQPYFLVTNKTKYDLRFMEENELADLWLDIAPGQKLPFWPGTDSLKMSLKYRDSSVISQHFPISKSHTSVLRMDNGSGITVRVEAKQDAPTTITFLPYTNGDAPVRVDNFSEDLFFKIHQKGQSQVTLLSPYQSVLYTWDDPTLDHILVWNLYNRKKPGFPAHIDKDGYGSEKLLFCTLRPGSRNRRSPQEQSSSDDDDDSEWEDGESLPNKTRKDKVVVHWVSYLEGPQRVLLFTQDDRVAALARKEMEGEGATLELFLSFAGAGLSMITAASREIGYVGVRGSPAVWELELDHCWKLLTLELSSWLEDRWKHQQTAASLRDLVTVDLAAMTMTKPVFGRLRRTVSPAFWCHLRKSPHYTALNLKLHRLQIDNQLPDAVFPVALYSAPTPLAVVRRLGPRPFGEVGLVMSQQPGSAPVVKHLKMLVQEFYLRADKGFLLSVHDLISTISKPIEPKVPSIQKRLRLIQASSETSNEETKSPSSNNTLRFEYIHLSPLKINFSFSPRGSVYKSFPDPWSFQHDLLEVFLSSVGATLSEMKDVELKMAFFERQGMAATWSDVASQAKSFYTCQVVQQSYVLLLGLDILGNPYGLIKDFTQGLGDFFYEPFLGAVYGPDEFAEGLAKGAQSLLGHIIGGTAGSISLMTGSVGQALAVLSFDEDYRKRRRLRLSQHPINMPETLMMAAKSLVLGVALGLSGVFVKPITGAQQEGAEGFFKGIGKGLMGLITKPAGGVFDMVSMAMDGIRRAAEMGEHVVVRLRLPRFVNPEQGLKPYSPFQASGNRLLQHLSKGHYADTDIYWAHAALSTEPQTSVAIITDKHVFLLEKGRFWGGWDIQWAIRVDDIISIPILGDQRLVITVRQEESFAGDERYLPCSDPQVLEWLKSKIEMVQLVNMEHKPCPADSTG